MKLRIVPASTGLTWVKLGVQTFGQHPVAMTALLFLTLAAMSLASVVPLVGPAVALAMLPASTLVMMVATAEVMQGRTPSLSLVVSTFLPGKPHRKDMLVLGVLYSAGFLAMMGLSALLDGGQFAQIYLGKDPLTPEIADDPAFQNAMWLALVLYLPLSMLFWHAPGLVYWHGVAPVKSLFFSIVACMRNFGAFLVFGLAWVGVFVGVGLAVSLFAGLLALLTGLQSAMSAILMGAALVMAAMFFTSVVFSFRDCFERPEKAEAASSASTV